MKGGALRGTRTSIPKSIMGQRANYQRAVETQAKRSITPGRARLNAWNAASREAAGLPPKEEEIGAMNLLKASILKLQGNIQIMESKIQQAGGSSRKTRKRPRKQSK